MPRLAIFFPFAFAFIIAVCTCTRKTTSAAQQFQDYYLHGIISSNEDTLKSYQFSYLHNGKFQYMVSQPDSDGSIIRNYYNGFCRTEHDTIFLFYKGGVSPPGVVDYIIKEASGGYLIQNFKGSNKRIFMRIFPRRHGR